MYSIFNNFGYDVTAFNSTPIIFGMNPGATGSTRMVASYGFTPNLLNVHAYFNPTHKLYVGIGARLIAATIALRGDKVIGNTSGKKSFKSLEHMLDSDTRYLMAGFMATKNINGGQGLQGLAEKDLAAGLKKIVFEDKSKIKADPSSIIYPGSIHFTETLSDELNLEKVKVGNVSEPKLSIIDDSVYDEIATNFRGRLGTAAKKATTAQTLGEQYHSYFKNTHGFDLNSSSLLTDNKFKAYATDLWLKFQDGGAAFKDASGADVTIKPFNSEDLVKFLKEYSVLSSIQKSSEIKLSVADFKKILMAGSQESKDAIEFLESYSLTNRTVTEEAKDSLLNTTVADWIKSLKDLNLSAVAAGDNIPGTPGTPNFVPNSTTNEKLASLITTYLIGRGMSDEKISEMIACSRKSISLAPEFFISLGARDFSIKRLEFDEVTLTIGSPLVFQNIIHNYLSKNLNAHLIASNLEGAEESNFLLNKAWLISKDNSIDTKIAEDTKKINFDDKNFNDQVMDTMYGVSNNTWFKGYVSDVVNADFKVVMTNSIFKVKGINLSFFYGNSKTIFSLMPLFDKLNFKQLLGSKSI